MAIIYNKAYQAGSGAATTLFQPIHETFKLQSLGGGFQNERARDIVALNFEFIRRTVLAERGLSYAQSSKSYDRVGLSSIGTYRANKPLSERRVFGKSHRDCRRQSEVRPKHEQSYR